MATNGEKYNEQLRRTAEVGKKYGYVLHWNPDLRRPMPIRMLEELGAHYAAAELRKLPWYPK